MLIVTRSMATCSSPHSQLYKDLWLVEGTEIVQSQIDQVSEINFNIKDSSSVTYIQVSLYFLPILPSVQPLYLSESPQTCI